MQIGNGEEDAEGQMENIQSGDSEKRSVETDINTRCCPLHQGTLQFTKQNGDEHAFIYNH